MPLTLIDIKPILELRARFERRNQREFSEAKNDDTSDLFGRARAGFRYTAGPIHGQAVVQYAYGENYNFNTHVSARRSDLVLGTVEAKLGESNLTLGRQRLAYGGERLLGAADWNNISNSWDGGRVGFRGGELFTVKSALLATPNNELSLYGGAYNLGPVHGLAVYKHDRRGEVDEATVSANLVRNFGPIRLDVEAAGQVGHRAAVRKLAGAVDAIASVPLARRLSFSLQGSLASGGHHGDTTNTFDQLYPSAHDKHGLLDMAGWQNLRDLGAQLRYDPDRRSTLKLQFHHLELDSARDAWYGAGGAPNRGPGGAFLDSTGQSGRKLGEEYDVDFTRSLDSRQSARIGAGIFRPGGFVRAFNGDSTKDQFFGYVQYTFRL